MSKFKRKTEIVAVIPKEEYPWVLREKRVKQLVSDYMGNFINSSVTYARARSGGYSLPLANYVHAVAKIQAQIIAGDKVGWDKAIIFGINYPLPDEEKHQFFERQKQQAEMGFIDVAIPTGRIAEWEANSTPLNSKTNGIYRSERLKIDADYTKQN